ncbi:hypothetical protein NC981_03425 [Leptolyngbya sp. DQ-M1]|uniref:hypothetical protein n=1 Tax=Leptolyngbya sp. DQ-M1 TaxID=2933920 RepID=UPI003298048A
MKTTFSHFLGGIEGRPAFTRTYPCSEANAQGLDRRSVSKLFLVLTVKRKTMLDETAIDNG